MSHFQSRWLAPALLCAGLSCNMYAVDGVILIDQNRALVGGVTPNDAAGFPVTITQSGSYRLSGNLTVPDANTTAIDVTADNVTIDLNGFSIIGPTVCVGVPVSFPVTSCSPTGDGDGVRSAKRNTTVVNGSVLGMGGIGIHLVNHGGYVEKVHADSNGKSGIAVVSGTVSGNTVNFNGDDGIDALVFATVIGNTAIGNRKSGILTNNSTVTGNTLSSNGAAGILVGCPSSVVGNTATSNSTNLSTFGAGCVLANNAAP